MPCFIEKQILLFWPALTTAKNIESIRRIEVRMQFKINLISKDKKLALQAMQCLFSTYAKVAGKYVVRGSSFGGKKHKAQS
jgi:hypothetical protein